MRLIIEEAYRNSTVVVLFSHSCERATNIACRFMPKCENKKVSCSLDTGDKFLERFSTEARERGGWEAASALLDFEGEDSRTCSRVFRVRMLIAILSDRCHASLG